MRFKESQAIIFEDSVITKNVLEETYLIRNFKK